jgi:uncharacterized protein with ATP-grasp and redox domains
MSLEEFFTQYVPPGSMKMDPECIPCLLRRVLFETELVAPDRTPEVMRESLEILSNGFHEGVNSAKLATEVHRTAYQRMGSEDPYLELKVRADEVALSLLPQAEGYIESSKDRLMAATLCAIAGNVMDFGIGKGFDDPDDLIEVFDCIIAQPLGTNDLPRIRRILESSGKALYFMDNCGEQVFDKLLVREIQSIGVEVTGVVKGRPVLTDVTFDDARRSSILDQFDRVLETGTFAIGVSVEGMGDELLEEMKATDLIIAKGMANFEALSDHCFRPIAYIMRAKCRPVANAIGAKKDDNVVKLYE